MFKRVFTAPIVFLLWMFALPLCCIIALMDSNNGQPFKYNLNTVMGKKNPAQSTSPPPGNSEINDLVRQINGTKNEFDNI